MMSSPEQIYLTKVSEIYNRLSLQGLLEHETGLHEVKNKRRSGIRSRHFEVTQSLKVGKGLPTHLADVALFNQFGPALFPTVMEVSVKRLQGPPPY